MGQGLGGEMLDAAMRYAFGALQVDRLCAMDVLKENDRSRGLFESRGFRIVRGVEDDAVDLEITRKKYRP